MSEMGDLYRDLKTLRKLERAQFGVACPVCKVKLPRGNATILLPQQRCRQHTPNYRDPRPELTTDDLNTLVWPEEPERVQRPSKWTECPTCRKRVKVVGLAQHLRDKHGEIS